MFVLPLLTVFIVIRGIFDRITVVFVFTVNFFHNCSIISIPDSPSVAQKTIASEVPPMTIVQEGMKDSAFGPVVVETFNDSHPVFENESIAQRFSLRTNTPLALRNMGFLTGAIPKQSCPGKLSLAQFQTPEKTPRMKRTEPLAESEDDSIAQLKSVYPLEKSILKATHFKRSLSVTDAEVYQKRVMFINLTDFLNLRTTMLKFIRSV